jgi:hypothetical protein
MIAHWKWRRRAGLIRYPPSSSSSPTLVTNAALPVFSVKCTVSRPQARCVTLALSCILGCHNNSHWISAQTLVSSCLQFNSILIAYNPCYLLTAGFQQCLSLCGPLTRKRKRNTMLPQIVRSLPLCFSCLADSFYTVPSLGLHSAAATGNVGLVEYALEHGQPINSVLDGVLPLHAACAGGNVQVVKLLMDHGADVNAPRSASFLLLCPLLSNCNYSALAAAFFAL